ncbi:cbl-interacting protein kinase 32 [Phtheirospermum japonicum]|uniref:Cbl-interacting protein kinase 32 n=1 Tax=Phtheirospermum japonicum TaxID=374723 RepID=A0A830D635_9LAMI|nr:cbl-interacting protein kinase 32 [Phtheirospermum japonicum]
MNTFELISMSKGLNLGNLFDAEQGYKRETRFTSKCPANEIINKIEQAAKPLDFGVQKKNYKMRLENLKSRTKKAILMSLLRFFKLARLYTWSRLEKQRETLWSSTRYTSLKGLIYKN